MVFQEGHQKGVTPLERPLLVSQKRVVSHQGVSQERVVSHQGVSQERVVSHQGVSQKRVVSHQGVSQEGDYCTATVDMAQFAKNSKI